MWRIDLRDVSWYIGSMGLVMMLARVMLRVLQVLTGRGPHRHPDLERAIEAARRAAYRAQGRKDQEPTESRSPWHEDPAWPFSEDPQFQQLLREAEDTWSKETGANG